MFLPSGDMHLFSFLLCFFGPLDFAKDLFAIGFPNAALPVGIAIGQVLPHVVYQFSTLPLEHLNNERSMAIHGEL